MAEIVTIWGVPYNADSPAVKKKICRTVDIYTGSRDPLNLEKFALLCEYVLNKIAELPQQIVSIDDAYKAIDMTSLVNSAHNEPDFFPYLKGELKTVNEIAGITDEDDTPEKITKKLFEAGIYIALEELPEMEFLAVLFELGKFKIPSHEKLPGFLHIFSYIEVAEFIKKSK